MNKKMKVETTIFGKKNKSTKIDNLLDLSKATGYPPELIIDVIAARLNTYKINGTDTYLHGEYTPKQVQKVWDSFISCESCILGYKLVEVDIHNKIHTVCSKCNNKKPFPIRNTNDEAVKKIILIYIHYKPMDTPTPKTYWESFISYFGFL